MWISGLSCYQEGSNIDDLARYRNDDVKIDD